MQPTPARREIIFCHQYQSQHAHEFMAKLVGPEYSGDNPIHYRAFS
jgi:hypothetical protein